MINPKLHNSLTDAIEDWSNSVCEEDWWYTDVGHVSDDMSGRLAMICALVLEESKKAQEIASD